MLPLARSVARALLSTSSRSSAHQQPNLRLLSTASASSASPSPSHDDSDDLLEVDLLRPYDTYLLDKDVLGTRVQTSRSELSRWFRAMNVMRTMEIRADMLYKNREIRGFCHLYDGQEAVPAGMESALTWDDAVITAYRDHAIYIARGGTVEAVMAELLGKSTGAARGKGGSMHLYKRENGMYGGWGIVGSQCPLGTGLAFAHKYRGQQNVSVTMYGDGAAQQGQLAEAMNMAALWKLPVIYTCENNQYGMGTSIKRSAADPRFYTRGHYIPGIKVDGMDPLAVKQAFGFAKSFVLENGPIVLELNTYRYHPHSMSDPGLYRQRKEIQEWREGHDPIERVRKLLLDNNFATEEELKDVMKEVKQEVEDAIKKAKEAPFPEDKELYRNIYVNDKGIPVRGVDYHEAHFTLPV